jgi:phospholipid/cholesterol/gamma-HCH transport system substrate-binding protein
VTGLSFVQLSDEGATGELRDPSDAVQARIELRASFLERVSESGEQLVARIGAVAVKLEQWLDEDNRRKAMQTLAAFEAAAQRVGALADATQPGVKAVPELARQAGETMRRADAALADLRVLAASLNQRVDAIDKIAVTAERIGSSVQAAAAAGVSLSSTASRETIPRLNALLDEISRSTRSLERLLEDLSANPSSIVFGRTPLPPGPGEPGFVHGVPR